MFSRLIAYCFILFFTVFFVRKIIFCAYATVYMNIIVLWIFLYVYFSSVRQYYCQTLFLYFICNFIYTCLLNKNATVTICHSKTKNLESITKQADILLVAIGRPKFVTADMVKEGATVIDVGINRNEEGKLVGDVDFDNVEPKVKYISPVPGGVGPMTIAMLMNNVVKAAKQCE